MRAYSILVMIAAMVFISFSGVLLRLMDGSDPWQINFYRAIAFTSAVMCLLLFRHGKAVSSAFKQAGGIALLGGFFASAAGIAYLQALTNTTVANTVFTLSAIPFFAAGLAYLFLREKLDRTTLAAMVVASIGIITMVADGIGTGKAFGNLMALLAALVFACYAVVIRGRRQVDMLPALVYAGCIVALVSAAARHDDLLISAKDVILCSIWGALLSGFANSAFVFASRALKAGEVSLLILLEFALAPIWVWLVVNEIPSKLTLIGGSIVMFAVFFKSLIEISRSASAKDHQT